MQRKRLIMKNCQKKNRNGANCRAQFWREIVNIGSSLRKTSSKITRMHGPRILSNNLNHRSWATGDQPLERIFSMFMWTVIPAKSKKWNLAGKCNSLNLVPTSMKKLRRRYKLMSNMTAMLTALKAKYLSGTRNWRMIKTIRSNWKWTLQIKMMRFSKTSTWPLTRTKSRHWFLTCWTSPRRLDSNRKTGN